MKDRINNKNRTIKYFKDLLIFSGIFNIVCASPLAIPTAYAYYFKFLDSSAQLLRLGGIATTISSDPTHALFVNIAGLHLVLTGVVVLFASKDPIKRYWIALFNGIGRTIFFAIIIYLTYQYNISKIWLIFGVLDFCISSAFVYYIVKLKRIGLI